MSSVSQYISLLRKNLSQDYLGMYREPGGALTHAFLTPGSEAYDDVLWDWDSWLSNIALRQILSLAPEEDRRKATPHERGCVLNFLKYSRKHGIDGWVPILISRTGAHKPDGFLRRNMHKPCLAQHAAFLVQADGGDAEWLRDDVATLQYFINCYRNHHRHSCGLYFWQNDEAIGVDNDPCTFGRPPRSSGSIFLNSLMYRELLAIAYVLERLDMGEIAKQYRQDADDLHAAVQHYCWDRRDGFFYSVDLNIARPAACDWSREHSHAGQPVDWPCLMQRIGVWSGFLPLWAGLATQEQAERAALHYTDPETFGAPYGVRTLSKMEPMYNLRASGNPSSWLGPIWGVSNYLTFRGFVRHRLNDAARDLAEKTIRLFARDIERFGALHEYYQPENGEPILNRGFQNWNYLVLNMAEWLEGGQPAEEF